MSEKRNPKVLSAIFILILLSAGVVVLIFMSGLATGGNPDDPHGGDQTNLSEALVWQSIYVHTTDGGSYWASPAQAMKALSIFGSQSGTGADWSQVDWIQNSLWMKVTSEKQIASWSFSCSETMTLNDQSGHILGTIVDGQTVNANGQSVAVGTNALVTQASLSAAQLEPLITQYGSGTAYIVVSIDNIMLTLEFTDGTTKTLTAVGSTPDNVMQWLIKTA